MLKRVGLFLAIVAAATTLTVWIVNAVFEDPPADDHRSWLRSWIGVGIDQRAEMEMRELIDRDSTDVSRHYHWITFHFSRPERTGDTDRDDAPIEAYYRTLLTSPNPQLADIARYAHGLMSAVGHQHCRGALDWFDQVSNRDLPYLNNSIGSCLRTLDRADEATSFFLREIDLGGNVSGASQNLAGNLLELGRVDELRAKIETDERFSAHLSSRFHRRLSLTGGHLVDYVGWHVKGLLNGFSVSGMAAASLILGIWLVFLIRLDVFEPERPHAVVIVLVGGMASAVICAVPYDLLSTFLGAGLSGTTVNDVLYCIFGIGLIEESVKLIPVLAVLRWTSWIDEPVDVVIYASASALGFAFIENNLYFHPFGLPAIHGRAFTATFMHMALSTMAAYGFVVAIRRKQPVLDNLPKILTMFSAAVAVHGVYDYFILGQGWVASIRIVSLVVFSLMVLVFQRSVSNGLSHSPFWSEGTNHRVINRWWYLGLTLSGVVLFEYVLLAGQFGPDPAGLGFMKAVLGSFLLLLIVVSHLATIEIKRFRWLPLLSRDDFRKKKTTKK